MNRCISDEKRTHILLAPRRASAAGGAGLLLAGVSYFALVASPAFAACSPVANGANPPPGTTVTCSGTTLNQNGNQGYGTGAQTGLMVNVLSGASVTGTAYGLYVNALTVINDGTIAGPGAIGIRSDSDLTVTNNAGAAITGIIAINAAGLASITNAGTIAATGNGIFTTSGGITLNNLASGVISVGGNTGIGSGSGNVAVTNAGLIRADINNIASAITGSIVTVDNAAGALVSARFSTISGNIITVTNAGTISAINGFAISSAQAGASTTVVNKAGGVITAPVYAASSTVGKTTVTNDGSITTTDATGYTIIAGANIDITNNVGATIAGNTAAYAGSGASSVFNAGTITGSGGTAIDFHLGANNVLTLAPMSVITGNVLGSGTDTLQFGGAGTGSFDVSQIGAAAQYRGFDKLGKTGTSDMTLTGSNSTAFPVSVSQGRLAVNGSLANAAFTVSGGILGGVGTIGATTVSTGGTLAPGNSIGTMAVNGNLTFNAGSTYTVEVAPGGASDRTNVTGTAALAGTLAVLPTVRLNARTTYTIMNAAGYSGAFNTTVVSNPAYARFSGLSVSGNDLLLSLDPGSLAAFLVGASRNQQNVAQGIDKGLSGGGALPPGFTTLFGLSGEALNNALTQVSGEAGAGSTQASFDASNHFMDLLSDPALHGGNGSLPNAAPLGYAAARKVRGSDAFAAFNPLDRTDSFGARWNVWAAGYGGSARTNGDSGTGSHSTTSRTYGVGVGADYLLSPDTTVGLALGGAGYNFDLAQGLGGGSADLFQVGLRGRTNLGPAYVSAALSYGWQDVKTDRAVSVGGTDRLHAGFNAHTFAARAETGYRVSTGFANVTPYAAVQSTSFMLPGYGETAISGSSQFALAYASKTTTNLRTELGARAEKSFAARDGVFTLSSRAAWAHDSNTNRSVTATFQSLPGSTFAVNGAQPSADAALVSAGAEMQWRNGLSLAGTFLGEFSGTTTAYAGKGALRYAW